MLKNLKREIKKSPLSYLLLALLLLFATYERVHNVTNNLGFYYDQGRDATVIWDFWKHGNFYLLGPTTGIEGIFRGPWYYWLITPAYILGGGNPVYPAVFLSLLSVLAVLFLFLIGKEIVNAKAGLLAAFISTFSYYIVVHSRWLSNPNPMLLISVLLLWSFIKAIKSKVWAWPLIGFLAGMAIQFGSATEIFYIPTVLIFVVYQRKNLPSKKILIFSTLLFLIAFAPQIIFDLFKGGVLTRAILKFLLEGNSFKLSFWEVAKSRLDQYYYLFSSIITPVQRIYLLPFLIASGLIIIFNPKVFFRRPAFKMLLIFIILPLVGMLFFQGNFGNVYDYYYSGYYLPVILLFSLPLGYAAEKLGGKIVVFFFIFLFFQYNTIPLNDFLYRGRTNFTFGDQKRAVEWIFQKSQGREFNVDVYVPPVIPYAYNYLFMYYLSMPKYQGVHLTESSVSLLYTLYELDPPNPQRLENWLTRQAKIGVVNKEFGYGAITMQERTRLK